MLKKDIELKKLLHVDETFTNFEGYNINHDLITKLNEVKVEVTLTYHESIKILDVQGIVKANFDAIDARDGKELKNNIETIDWDEQYSFEVDEISPDNNIVLGEEFDILGYAIDEIVLNIPVNFTKNYDKITVVNEFGGLFDEDDYQSSQENKTDSRWDKLKDYKFEK